MHGVDQAVIQLEHLQAQLLRAKEEWARANEAWVQAEDCVGAVSALICSKDLPTASIFNTSRSRVAQPSPNGASDNSCTSDSDNSDT
jgi:hypothetical protein